MPSRDLASLPGREHQESSTWKVRLVGGLAWAHRVATERRVEKGPEESVFEA